MPIIYVNSKKYSVKESDNLLKACLSLGFDIPYFCWHPALGSIGACRQCAVKQFKNSQDYNGNLIMSCMTQVSEGIRISIEDNEAKEFRKGITELLMIHHPHDCPVCEEGGNCHLQDMTVMTGHISRRYRFTKRTHYNQELGPFISHEMNRCISCYRCVRYYKDYVGGHDFGVYGIHDNLYFGRLKDGVLESEFAGNLVEICPTGVFTDKTYSKFYNRKWDMQFSPSICQHCSIGCNISPGERYGKVIRIENRYNSDINGYFLCDRGRFGYGYVNREDRPCCPEQLRGHDRIFLNAEQAINVAIDILQNAKGVIGIGSPRASIESNFALRKLVGDKNFSTGIPLVEQQCINLVLQILQKGGIYTPSICEIENYDTILVLGEDLTQVSARLALAVRQAVKSKAYKMSSMQNIANWHTAAVMNLAQNTKNPLFITHVDKTSLEDVATWNYCAPIEDQARLGFAIAHFLDSNSPPVKNLDISLNEKIYTIAKALLEAKKPLIISGTHSGSTAIIAACANIAKALKIHGSNVGITLLTSTVNSMGVGLIGGEALDSVLEKFNSGDADVLVILENDLYRHISEKKADSLLKKASKIIVLDHQRTATLQKAGLVLSSASFAESDGTVVNYEGRAQRYFQVYESSYYYNKSIVAESWRWLYSIYGMMHDYHHNLISLDRIIDDIVVSLPQLKEIKNAAPNANFRIHGQKIARSPHRSSGRTAIRANINIHEPRQPQDPDTMFAFSMEGNSQSNAPHSQIPFVWSAGWNSPQAWNKFQNEVGGQLRYGNPGIRLLSEGSSVLQWYTDIPESYVKSSSLLIIPYYRLFGSEEMSQRCHVFQQRMPAATLIINPIDAKRFALNDGSVSEIMCEGERLKIKICFSSSLHNGLVGLPIGMPGISFFFIGKQINTFYEVT